MWSGSPRWASTALAAAVACLTALLVLAPAALAAPGVTLRLPAGGGQSFIAADRIQDAADVPVTEYVLRTPDGREERVFQTGTRLATVLRLAGLDPAAVSFLELSRPDGSVLAMPREAIDPAAGPPPLVWVDGDTVGFIRPSSGPGDANARDSFSFADGSALRVLAYTGARLTVSAEAGRERIRAGEAVTFTGEAVGAGEGELLEYEWRFGDGTTAIGARARHVFRRPGRYDVVLRVTGDRDSGGTSEPISIQVGKPTTKGEGGGGESRERAAPQSGPRSGGSEGGGPAPEDPAPPPEDPAPPPEEDETSADTGPQRDERAERRDERRRRAERNRSRRRASPGAPRVSGVRIENVGNPVAPTRAAQSAPAARIGGPASDPDESGLFPAGAIALVALLAFGIWRETKEG
jgi:PKD domain